jgi:hypothetical protein
MQRSMRDVLERLEAEGLAPAGSAETARAELAKEFADHLPWYLRSVVAVGAFLSTSFLLFFIFSVAGLRGDFARLILGAGLIAIAPLIRRDEKAEFARWASVAVGLAGMGVVTFTLGEMTDDATAASLACLACAFALIWYVDDYVLRFLATLAGGAALFVALVDLRADHGRVAEVYDLGIVLIVAAAAWIWRAHLARRGDKTAEILEPMGYGAVVVLFGALIVRTLFASARGSFGAGLGTERRLFADPGWVAGIALTAALVALVWRILDELDVPLSSQPAVATLFGAAAFGLGAATSPGIIAGVAVLILAFDRRNVQLIGISALFLIFFLSFYYYNLDLTLLEKSGVLIGSGALLIGIRQTVARSA